MRVRLLAIVALWVSDSAAARPKALPADEDICLSVGHSWNGWPADVAQIANTPVPASFRTLTAQTGCARWQLIDESLIDWHLRFGTEATTITALEYLATEYDRRSDLAETKPDRWLDLGLMAVRAGELYRSPVLLALVDRYATRAAAAPPGLSAYHNERAAWLTMRCAALRALVTRSPRDIDAARTLLQSRSTPALEELRHASYRDEICGDGAVSFDRATVKAACDTINNFDREALVYWEARARIALADVVPTACANDRSPAEVDNALALLTAQLDPKNPLSARPDYLAERIMALYLPLADATAFRACLAGDEGWEARRALLQAERLTPAATAPAQYRMIGERYLALPNQPGDRWRATFRVILAHLDEITATTLGSPAR